MMSDGLLPTLIQPAELLDLVYFPALVQPAGMKGLVYFPTLVQPAGCNYLLVTSSSHLSLRLRSLIHSQNFINSSSVYNESYLANIPDGTLSGFAPRD